MLRERTVPEYGVASTGKTFKQHLLEIEQEAARAASRCVRRPAFHRASASHRAAHDSR